MMAFNLVLSLASKPDLHIQHNGENIRKSDNAEREK